MMWAEVIGRRLTDKIIAKANRKQWFHKTLQQKLRIGHHKPTEDRE